MRAKRNQPQITKVRDLRLKLTKMETQIKQLCNQHQAQSSHLTMWLSTAMNLSKLCYMCIYNSYQVVASVVMEQKQMLLTCGSSGGAWDFLHNKMGPGSKKVENHCSKPKVISAKILFTYFFVLHMNFSLENVSLKPMWECFARDFTRSNDCWKSQLGSKHNFNFSFAARRVNWRRVVNAMGTETRSSGVTMRNLTHHTQWRHNANDRNQQSSICNEDLVQNILSLASRPLLVRK